MLVAVLAMLVGGGGVVLGLVVLAMRMMMRRLKMMVSRGMMMSGRLVMMLVGRMLLRHLCVPLDRCAPARCWPRSDDPRLRTGAV